MALMLSIRLQRVGKKNEPTFRIVLTDSKNSTKSGKFLEILGSYDARDKNETKINTERVEYWMSKGAQLSDTIHNLFVNKEVIKGEKINVLPKKSPIVKETEEGEESKPAEGEAKPEEVKTEEAPAEAPTEEAPKEEVKTDEPAPVEEKKEEVVEEEKAEASLDAPAEEKKEETPAA